MANDLFDIDWDLLDEQDLIVITNTMGLERTPRLSAREAALLGRPAEVLNWARP